MKLNIINEHPFTFSYELDFDQILKYTLTKLNKEDIYVVSCIFVDDEKIHEINKTYRNIDRATDVISFALQDDTSFLLPQMDEIELGDIFISIDTCERQAKEYNHSFKREICFLFVHGLLHLFGYDHMNAADEKEMINLQKEILNEIIFE